MLRLLTRAASSRRTSLGGLIEAVATPHAVDRYLELVDPMLTWKDCRAQVVSVERRTENTVTMRLRPTRQWRGFTAGQFVRLGVVVDGVKHLRCFSPANRDTERGEIELTVTRRPGGIVSNHLFDNARVGSVFDLKPPAGDFALPLPGSTHTVLIAGGSGITPVLSMLRSLERGGAPGQVALLYFVRTDSDNPYRAELEELSQHPNVRVRCVSTRAGGEHFTVAQLEELAPWYASAQTFVSGPPTLLAAVELEYDQRRIADRLHMESFAPLETEPSVAGGTLKFAEAGLAADNDGTTILAQAEAAGLSPEVGCRRGICFTCVTPKLSGSTRNVLSGEVEEGPDLHVQICVSVPVGDVTMAL